MCCVGPAINRSPRKRRYVVYNDNAVPSEVGGIPFQPRGGAGVVYELLRSLF